MTADTRPSCASSKATMTLIALSNSRRLLILKMLCEREWEVTALARSLHISQPSLSQHLAKLKQAGLVTASRQSTTIRYKCASPFVEQILMMVERNFPEGVDSSIGDGAKENQ